MKAKRRNLMAWLIGGLVGLCGCASVEMTSGPRPVQPLSEEEQQYYVFAPVEQAAMVGMPHAGKGFTMERWHLALPGTAAGGKPMELIWFRPEGIRARPVVLMAPILGGDLAVSGIFARLFAQEGFHAVVVRRPPLRYDPQGPVTQVEDYMRASVVRNRQALDWLLRQPGVDDKQVGTFGISFGAIVNAALAGIEPRARCHVFALAGGPIADVLEISEERRLRRYWRQTQRIHGWSDKELRRLYLATIRTDPTLLARHVAPQDVMVVVALLDRSVGGENSLRLWRRLGRPQATFLPTGHYSAVLALPYLRWEALRFFKSRFQLPPPVGNGGLVYRADH